MKTTAQLRERAEAALAALGVDRDAWCVDDGAVRNDGVVIDTLQGEPFSTASIGPGAPSRFVLELHSGTADDFGMVSGTRLHHPIIDAVADQ